MDIWTALTIALWVIFFLVGFVGRSVVQWKRTGDAGFRLSRAGGANARVASALMALGMLGGFLGAVTFAFDAMGIVDGLDSSIVRALGIAAMLAALAITAKSQFDLSDSWRIGVDDTERTALVTTGVYASVRNPIFSGMFLFATGGALAVGTWPSLVAVVMTLAGFEIQVRRVEEPYLARTHGKDFRAYAARAGRFVPSIGRIPTSAPLT
jgi:protein-S-isoprenylcysteine O-methyltransferase Ste14